MNKVKINYDSAKINKYILFNEISQKFKSGAGDLIFTLDTMGIKLVGEECFNKIIDQISIDQIENFERNDSIPFEKIDFPVIFDPGESKYYKISEQIRHEYNLYKAQFAR